MTFLHPLALLGLAATAIPALLHLLDRRVPPEADFPPLRYLSEAERQSERRLKLRHLLLLLLRTALIALIVLAAARPFVRARVTGAAAHQPTALVVILDNSLSSGAVVDGHPVLDRLRAVARGSLAASSTSDRLWLVLADGVARAGTREALVTAVDSARVSFRRLDLTAAVRDGVRLVDAEPLAGREVHVVSDLQRTAFGPGRVRLGGGARVLALAPPTEAPANRGVGVVRVAAAAVSVGVTGTPGAGPTTVTVHVRGREVGRALAAPGSTVSVPLPVLGPGWWVGDATLEADELRGDDRRLFAWREAPPAGATAASEAGPFVAAALAVLEQAGRVRPGPGVRIDDRGPTGAAVNVVLPPAEPALVGQVNRALAARGARWRLAAPGTPGPITAPGLREIAGVPVTRRYRLEPTRAPSRGGDPDTVLATVNDEPWLVRDGALLLVGSRLDTAWTALPARSGFVPFVDALVNRLARGEAPVTDAEGVPMVSFAIRGSDTVGATVYGTDPRESDLTPASAGLVHDVLGAEVLDADGFARARFTGTERADMSGPLLLLALLVAAAELGFATFTR